MERSEVRRRIMEAVETAASLSLDNLTWGVGSAAGRNMLVEDIMLIVDEVIESETEPIAQEV